MWKQQNLKKITNHVVFKYAWPDLMTMKTGLNYFCLKIIVELLLSTNLVLLGVATSCLGPDSGQSVEDSLISPCAPCRKLWVSMEPLFVQAFFPRPLVCVTKKAQSGALYSFTHGGQTPNSKHGKWRQIVSQLLFLSWINLTLFWQSGESPLEWVNYLYSVFL